MSNPNATPEESMSPPPETSMVQEYLPSAIGESANAMLQLINLNGNNVYHEPTCIICSCSNREEVEQKWFEVKNHEETKKIFKSKNVSTISNDIIDNHMRNHHDKGTKELQKIGYINTIRRLNSSELTTLDRIRDGLSMLTERMVGVNSITPNNDLSVAEVEKTKSAETARLMMAYNQLLKLKASIMGEMKSSGDLIVLPRKEFVDTFNRAIVKSKSNEERETIKNILNSLVELNKKTQ